MYVQSVTELNLRVPYRTKISSDKIFDGQNISSDKIFRHQAEISTILSDLCLTFVLKYWTKFFVGQNIRHQVKISTILSDEFLSGKVVMFI